MQFFFHANIMLLRVVYHIISWTTLANQCNCLFTIGYNDSIVSIQEEYLWNDTVVKFNCDFDVVSPATPTGLTVAKTISPSNVITYTPAAVGGDFVGRPTASASSDANGVYAEVTLYSTDVDHYTCTVSASDFSSPTIAPVDITTFYDQPEASYLVVTFEDNSTNLLRGSVTTTSNITVKTLSFTRNGDTYPIPYLTNTIDGSAVTETCTTTATERSCIVENTASGTLTSIASLHNVGNTSTLVITYGGTTAPPTTDPGTTTAVPTTTAVNNPVTRPAADTTAAAPVASTAAAPTVVNPVVTTAANIEPSTASSAPTTSAQVVTTVTATTSPGISPLVFIAIPGALILIVLVSLSIFGIYKLSALNDKPDTNVYRSYDQDYSRRGYNRSKPKSRSQQPPVPYVYSPQSSPYEYLNPASVQYYTPIIPTGGGGAGRIAPRSNPVYGYPPSKSTYGGGQDRYTYPYGSGQSYLNPRSGYGGDRYI